MKEEFARTRKELDFQREVNAAWQRLYPGTLPVNMGNASGVAHDSGGRLALFYLVDSQGSDDALRSWARDHHIPVEKVRKRQITLNHDGGRWMRFGNGLMPVLLQQAGDGKWAIAAF